MYITSSRKKIIKKKLPTCSLRRDEKLLFSFRKRIPFLSSFNQKLYHNTRLIFQEHRRAMTLILKKDRYCYLNVGRRKKSRAAFIKATHSRFRLWKSIYEVSHKILCCEWLLCHISKALDDIFGIRLLLPPLSCRLLCVHRYGTQNMRKFCFRKWMLCVCTWEKLWSLELELFKV